MSQNSIYPNKFFWSYWNQQDMQNTLKIKENYTFINWTPSKIKLL